MYQGKRLQKKISPDIRCRGKNAAVLFPALALLLALSVGGTAAFLVAQGDPIKNEFVPSKVSCQVIEDELDQTQKAIKNTGDTAAYIRAAIVVTWKDTAGNIYAGKPQAGENKDYTITLNDESWVQGSDGFYYHKEPVAADQSSAVLIESCAPMEGKTPAGYSLNVEILGSAIQSVPAAAAESSWGVTVAEDGTISK